MSNLRITTTETRVVELSIDAAAEWFCGLDDDQMCKFLVAVAEKAERFQGSPDNQWYFLGGHLKSCECSTERAREMIRSWAHYMETSNHV